MAWWEGKLILKWHKDVPGKAINIMESVQRDLGLLSKVEYVVRRVIFVVSDDGFTDQHLVGHGASQTIFDVFGSELDKHSRTAIGVKSLPPNTPVEVDTIFALRD
jgi:enamine deaminase RidA (YjgF/YER057c/UK114 family)